MINTIKQDVEERMNKTIGVLRSDFQTIRTGKASPSLLDRIQVDYYGSPTPINQLANISTPEARMLVIQPWDKSAISAIEKAILKSDLGITPTSDGIVIRLVLPQLTQENRKDLVKRVKKKGEEAKVSVRNIRRDGNDELKALEKSKEITEDESKGAQGIGVIIRNVLAGEQGVDLHVLLVGNGAENCRDTGDVAAVVLDALQAPDNGLAGGNGGKQQQDVLVPDHLLDVVPEDDLAAGVELRGHKIDILVRVDGHMAGLGQLPGHEAADDLAAVHAHNGINGMGDVAGG